MKKVPQWELARAVLLQQGVPPHAIVIPEDDAVGTLEELQAVWGAVGARSWVLGVGSLSGRPTSIASSSAELSSIPAFQLTSGQTLPVILVTSKYHTRRTRLTWQYVTGGQSQPIVRAASGDPFDPESWWKTRGYALSVVREYLGLANYYLGFPVTP